MLSNTYTLFYIFFLFQIEQTRHLSYLFTSCDNPQLIPTSELFLALRWACCEAIYSIQYIYIKYTYTYTHMYIYINVLASGQ